MTERRFKPSHQLTFDTVSADSRRMLLLLRDNLTTSICLDLGDVTQCDSAGLALLIDTKRLCHQYHKRLSIEGIPHAVSALAEFCGLDTLLN